MHVRMVEVGGYSGGASVAGGEVEWERENGKGAMKGKVEWRRTHGDTDCRMNTSLSSQTVRNWYRLRCAGSACLLALQQKSVGFGGGCGRDFRKAQTANFLPCDYWELSWIRIKKQ